MAEECPARPGHRAGVGRTSKKSGGCFRQSVGGKIAERDRVGVVVGLF